MSLIFLPVVAVMAPLFLEFPEERLFVIRLLAPFFLLWAGALLYSLFVFVLVVGPDGIVMYRINRLKWPDVVDAYETSFLRLPYLKLERKRGMHWWLPLWFRGPVDIREALRTAAPQDHPIRLALD